MTTHHLAQLNIAKLKAPIDSPLLADFVANLPHVNHIADTSAGFVWRMQGPEGNATAVRAFGDDMIVNMSVWKDLDALKAYMSHREHLAVMKRRREWFHSMDEAYAVMWWVEAGHIPSVDEAKERLEHFRRVGPSSHAFGFRQEFAPPAAVSSGVALPA